MVAEPVPSRVALVVHPKRPIEGALATLKAWAAEHGVDVVQLAVDGGRQREVAPPGTLEDGDLVVAVGGDGTVLAALHAAAPKRAPVLGVACGSLGALSAVTADRLEEGLGRLWAGDWTAKSLPALAIAEDGGARRVGRQRLRGGSPRRRPAGRRDHGRRRALCARRRRRAHRGHRDGLERLFDGRRRARARGGRRRLRVHPAGHARRQRPAAGGLRRRGGAHRGLPELRRLRRRDRRARAAGSGLRFRLSLDPDRLTLVSFGPSGRGLAGLRKRGLITDSPRVLAREARDGRATG